MKRTMILVLFLVLAECIYSQLAPGYYLLWLKDKKHNNYSLSRPNAFLSLRALQRRIKEGIPMDESDLPVSSFYTDSLQKLGLKIHTVSHWFNNVVIESYDTLLLDTLHRISFIKAVDIGSIQLKSASPVQMPDKFSNERELSNWNNLTDSSYGLSARQISMLNGDSLHMLGLRGQGMVIAVLDAGFYKLNEVHTFDSLWNDNRVLGTHDFVSGDGNVFEDHQHGMMVMSVMAGNSPGHLIGTAPEASYWLLRSENANSEYLIEEENWIAAAEFADSAGADIISTSLGYSRFDWPFQNHTYADMNGESTHISIAADMASKKGMLVVASAGNEGSTSWQHIMAPADAKKVLAVGAVDYTARYVSFSSRGPSYDGRIKPDIAAQGSLVWVSTANSTFSTASGTSFSAPLISGLSACLWQAFPQLTNMQIRSAIEQSANQYNSPDSLLGFGIPNFIKAIHILEQNKYQPSSANQVLWAYPNPFHDQLTIQLKSEIEETEILVEIFDRVGRKVLSSRFIPMGKYTYSIPLPDVSSLDKGIYIMRCTTANRSHQIKIIKQ